MNKGECVEKFTRQISQEGLEILRATKHTKLSPEPNSTRLKVPGWSSQAPTHVEVELGCDNNSSLVFTLIIQCFIVLKLIVFKGNIWTKSILAKSYWQGKHEVNRQVRICQNLTFEDNEFKDNKALNDQGKDEETIIVTAQLNLNMSWSLT